MLVSLWASNADDEPTATLPVWVLFPVVSNTNQKSATNISSTLCAHYYWSLAGFDANLWSETSLLKWSKVSQLCETRLKSDLASWRGPPRDTFQIFRDTKRVFCSLFFCQHALLLTLFKCLVTSNAPPSNRLKREPPNPSQRQLSHKKHTTQLKLLELINPLPL